MFGAFEAFRQLSHGGSQVKLHVEKSQGLKVEAVMIVIQQSLYIDPVEVRTNIEDSRRGHAGLANSWVDHVIKSRGQQAEVPIYFDRMKKEP